MLKNWKMKPGKGQTPGVSELGTEEDCHEFKASLCTQWGPCLKTQEKRTERWEHIPEWTFNKQLKDGWVWQPEMLLKAETILSKEDLMMLRPMGIATHHWVLCPFSRIIVGFLLVTMTCYLRFLTTFSVYGMGSTSWGEIKYNQKVVGYSSL